MIPVYFLQNVKTTKGAIGYVALILSDKEMQALRQYHLMALHLHLRILTAVNILYGHSSICTQRVTPNEVTTQQFLDYITGQMNMALRWRTLGYGVASKMTGNRALIA